MCKFLLLHILAVHARSPKSAGFPVEPPGPSSTGGTMLVDRESAGTRSLPTGEGARASNLAPRLGGHLGALLLQIALLLLPAAATH